MFVTWLPDGETTSATITATAVNAAGTPIGDTTSQLHAD